MGAGSAGPSKPLNRKNNGSLGDIRNVDNASNSLDLSLSLLPGAWFLLQSIAYWSCADCRVVRWICLHLDYVSIHSIHIGIGQSLDETRQHDGSSSVRALYLWPRWLLFQSRPRIIPQTGTAPLLRRCSESGIIRGVGSAKAFPLSVDAWKSGQLIQGLAVWSARCTVSRDSKFRSSKS